MIRSARNFVESLGRPGGNATGLSIVATDLSGKRLQLLKEIVPRLSSIAVMSYGPNPQSQMELKETQIAAQRLDIRVYSVPISPDLSIENAFEKIKKETVQALIVVTDPILYSQRTQILALAAGNRLPAMYPYRAFADAGGLISYAPNDRDIFRRAASYVDKILPLREVVWVILAHFRTAVFCCCCRCGHVGNALALSIMSTASRQVRRVTSR